MAIEHTKDLLKFLKPFPKDVQHRALWLRDLAWTLYPKANELIYDNYNALAFGWSVTDRVGHTFCNVAVGRSSHNVHFGFYWGSEISDPKNMLLGEGNQYRYVLVKNVEDFPKEYIKSLLKEAHANSLSKVKDPKQIKEGLTILKSISPVKRPESKKTASLKKIKTKKVVKAKKQAKTKKAAKKKRN